MGCLVTRSNWKVFVDYDAAETAAEALEYAWAMEEDLDNEVTIDDVGWARKHFKAALKPEPVESGVVIPLATLKRWQEFAHSLACSYGMGYSLADDMAALIEEYEKEEE